ncbi:hypothetical protein F5887DRAFT_1082353 [Amanita rubescens]|nr:hypothetical protein F5887DRAFT_1082353 [Amanita rubescens]
MSKSSIRSRLRPDRAHLGIRARLLPALTVLAVEINVLATGRVNSQIRNEFQGHGKVIIGRDDINHDARRFVETDVRHVKTRDPQLVRDIIDRLISGAQGTFLWPSYHMRRLRKLRTDYDIREALDDLPHGMEDTLSRALETIDAHPNSDRIRRVLRLAIYAVQPLTLYELAEGIATGEMIDVWDPARVVTDPISLIDDCANLLVCAPSSTFPYLPDVVIPFHASVKEFLANPARITQPFLRYALYPQSVVHCDLAYEELGALQLYDKNGVKVELHLLTPGQLAVRLDLAMLIPHFCTEELMAEDNRGSTPLCVAVERSASLMLVDNLLRRVDVNQINCNSETALHIAASTEDVRN